MADKKYRRYYMRHRDDILKRHAKFRAKYKIQREAYLDEGVWDGLKIHDIVQEVFPPICPVCGSQMGWNADFNPDECGYVPEDSELLSDSVVHSCHCGQCEGDADFISYNEYYVFAKFYKSEDYEE